MQNCFIKREVALTSTPMPSTSTMKLPALAAPFSHDLVWSLLDYLEVIPKQGN
ncbi:hypothetical protein [Abiotrophia sp.]|uniref:hypothetical protein n=1 Tax=Abiotrophia sp. TaxID=76631 RepID=UPI001CB1BD4C|nr:hypothetical protein [Abiotrophia sp.]MBF0937387.1 hypothetical protein [Abiotrophia sp.]